MSESAKPTEIEEIYEMALDMAQMAGQMIKDTFYEEKTTVTKECFADLVTETDKKIEDQVMAAIHEKFPSHKFIGEETVSGGKKCDWTDDPTWIIDPIDGTTNFVHRITYTCISIGVSINKQMVVGVVYAPLLNKMYTAKKGQGAFLNGQPIKVSDVKELQKSVVIAEFGTSRDEHKLDQKLQSMKNVIRNCVGIRCYGSAALNACSVAEGIGHAYFEYGIHIWDIAAADVILTEAGGVIRCTTGNDIDLLNRRIICASAEPILKELSPLLVEVEFERD